MVAVMVAEMVRQLAAGATHVGLPACKQGALCPHPTLVVQLQGPVPLLLQQEQHQQHWRQEQDQRITAGGVRGQLSRLLILQQQQQVATMQDVLLPNNRDLLQSHKMQAGQKWQHEMCSSDLMLWQLQFTLSRHTFWTRA
jgi:hypothetical protein